MPYTSKSDSSSLVDLALVSVVGAVDGQGMLQSPDLSACKEKKKNITSEDKFPSSKPAKSSTDKPAKSAFDSRSAKSSSDAIINALDQKWSDRFNQLEVLLLARSMQKPEPTFQTPTHPPTVGSVKATDPFIKLTADLSLSLSLPTDQHLQICVALTTLLCRDRLRVH